MPHREPLSPELVLVDPVLAAEARALLAERPWIEPVRLEEDPAPAPAPETPVLPHPALDEEERREPAIPAKRARRRLPLRAAGIALAAAAVVVLALDLVPARGPDPVLVPAREDRSGLRAFSPTDAVAATQPAPVERPAQKAIETPRTFVWPEAANAAGYEFQLFRGAELVFRSRTTAPRLVIPVSWKYRGRRESLRRGTYRWYVWPIGRGGRGPAARALVQAELVVSR